MRPQVLNTDLSNALLSWYDKAGRDLPWRVKNSQSKKGWMKNSIAVNPYKVWLSEIMLQQTTVATVKPYFEKFITLWPTVEDLASAPVDLVMKEWAGLGYYARARNLHRCAQIISRDYHGQFPKDEKTLLKLPGIGAYTAAAIAAIAFNQPSVVIDGNIERVFARLLGDATPLPALKTLIRSALQPLVPLERPGDFAQALMDLGATICTPRKPACLLCPVRTHCVAHKQKIQESLPVKPDKKAKPVRRAAAFLILYQDQILLEKRSEKGLLGGMTGLPHTEWIEQSSFPALPRPLFLSETLSFDFETKPHEGEALPDISRHTFTHFHLESILYKILFHTKPDLDGTAFFWQPLNTIKEAGLPTVFKKMVQLLR